MVIVMAIVGTLVLGVVLGLAVRGCLILGDRRQLDLTVQRLMAEARIDAVTRQTLARIRETTREAFRQ